MHCNVLYQRLMNNLQTTYEYRLYDATLARDTSAFLKRQRSFTALSAFFMRFDKVC